MGLGAGCRLALCTCPEELFPLDLRLGLGLRAGPENGFREAEREGVRTRREGGGGGWGKPPRRRKRTGALELGRRWLRFIMGALDSC